MRGVERGTGGEGEVCLFVEEGRSEVKVVDATERGGWWKRGWWMC